MDVPFHLSPTMASRKLQALRFIRRYFSEWGGSPSLGEIQQALSLNSRQQARDVVAQLAAEGKITRQSGRRGIGLPDLCDEICNDDLLRALRARGVLVDSDFERREETKTSLPQFPDLAQFLAVKPGDKHP